MKKCLILLLAMGSASAFAAPADTAYHPIQVQHLPFEKNSTIATLSLGFIDRYRNSLSLPAGFGKATTSGFAPIYAKLEYGVSKHISIAGTFGYDAFTENFRQDYVGTVDPVTRYRANNTRIFSGGLTAYYHLVNVIPVKHLDPFIGLGFSLNNIRYSQYPQGDSTMIKLDHTLTPYIKAGARYYISSAFSLFGDVGYDHHSAFSIGVSCRFAKDRYYPDADRDGIPDFVDSCMHDKGTKKLHGCPDADGDGIIDKEDSCPNEAGTALLHGCPDSDGDGIADKDDDCPHDKGPEKFKGCPDRDGDGIPDKDDACPDVPGITELRGCPEKVREIADPVLILPEVTKLPLKFITFKTGSAVIQPSSYTYLGEIADTLNTHRPAAIMIDGYTDNTGNAAINKRLSAARAEAVKKYLLHKGVDVANIYTNGHGSASPVVSNRTKKGRAKNRRATIKLKQPKDN